MTDEVIIAVNEACANAIEHAYPPSPATFELLADEAGGEVRITVRDSGRWRPPRDTNGGHGMRMISRAMDDVSIEGTESGTEVQMRRRLAAR